MCHLLERGGKRGIEEEGAGEDSERDSKTREEFRRETRGISRLHLPPLSPNDKKAITGSTRLMITDI